MISQCDSVRGSSSSALRAGLRRRTFSERAGLVSVLGAALCAAALGCAPVGEAEDEDAAAGADSLLPESWRNFGTLSNTKARRLDPISTTNPAFPIADEPVVFATRPLISTLAVRNSTDKKFYLRTRITYNESAWTKFDGKSFASPPAATHFAAFADGSTIPSPYYFVIAGKHTSVSGGADSSKLFAMVGTAYNGASSTNPQPPTPGTWVQLGSESYANAGEAYPALSTSGSRVVLTFRAANSSGQQRIFTFHRPTSATGTWSSRVTAPAFPSGVVPAGVPAIAYLNGATGTAYANKFVILTRTQVGGIAWIMYNPTASSPWGTWYQAFIPRALESDPAVDWDPTHKVMTLYYKVKNYDDAIEVVNTTVTDPGGIGAYPFYFIDVAGDATLLGSPRVTMGGGIEGGCRRVLAFRGYDSSVPSNERDKTIMYTQDIYNYPPLW